MSNVLGLSHLCVGCAGAMDEVERALVECGYAVQFAHADLPNPPAKKGLVRTWTALHDMRLLAAPGLPAIETLHHHDVAVSGGSNYRPHVYVPEVGGPAQDTLVRFGVSLVRENRAASGKLLVTMACADIRSQLVFWEKAMGFAVHSCDGDGAELRFRALSPTWCIDLRLEKSGKPVEPTYLDDTGCTCLSFLVRDIGEALEKCREFGAVEIGVTFPLEIGGKSVDVAFVRGPQSEIIELLQFG